MQNNSVVVEVRVGADGSLGAVAKGRDWDACLAAVLRAVGEMRAGTGTDRNTDRNTDNDTDGHMGRAGVASVETGRAA